MVLAAVVVVAAAVDVVGAAVDVAAAVDAVGAAVVVVGAAMDMAQPWIPWQQQRWWWDPQWLYHRLKLGHIAVKTFDSSSGNKICAAQVWTCFSHSEFFSANDINTVTPCSGYQLCLRSGISFLCMQ